MPCRLPNSCSIVGYSVALRLSLRLASLAAILCLLVAPVSSALPIPCIDEHGRPCPRDERPPISGRDAERNLQRVERAQRLPEGSRVFDLRNGHFVIISEPRFWGAVPGGRGYCSVQIEDNVEFVRSHFVHAETSEAECRQEADQFAHGSMERPLAHREFLNCEMSEGYWCFAALNQLRDYAARVDHDPSVRIAGPRRERDGKIEMLRSILSEPHPWVFTTMDGGRWFCIRVSPSPTIDRYAFDGQALVCDDAVEGANNVTIYVSGRWIE